MTTRQGSKRDCANTTALSSRAEEMQPRWLVHALGWASIAMGMTLLAPSRAARLFGLGSRPRLMIAIGARDLAIGLGLLNSRHPARWLRVQALADAIDAVIVGVGLLKGTVARWRGFGWVVVALASGGAGLVHAARLDKVARRTARRLQRAPADTER